MKFKYPLIICLLFLTVAVQAQTTHIDIDFEFQAYPTGLIPGMRFEAASGKNAGHIRLGLNWIRHGSAGVHDNERGQGFGFSLGYKRYFTENHLGYFVELKNDLWFNEIDWKDNLNLPNEFGGRSDVVVTQPTIGAGYMFQLNPYMVISPTLAFGYEVNLWTDGEPTGEGAIFLLGFHTGWRLAR